MAENNSIVRRLLGLLRGNPLDSMPDFQHFPYVIAVAPPSPRLTAWGKLREAERRLAMYRWSEQLNDPSKAQHRILLDDTVSAFLMNFEATVQFLKTQYEQNPARGRFYTWLGTQGAHDVCVRGLRTLRHFEAHVEEKKSPRTVHLHVGTVPPVPARCTWRLPELDATELAKLQWPPLQPTDLGAWNALAVGGAVGDLFEDGLSKLKQILDAAEPLV